MQKKLQDEPDPFTGVSRAPGAAQSPEMTDFRPKKIQPDSPSGTQLVVPSAPEAGILPGARLPIPNFGGRSVVPYRAL